MIPFNFFFFFFFWEIFTHASCFYSRSQFFHPIFTILKTVKFIHIVEYRNFYTHRKLEEETYGFNNWWSRISTIHIIASIYIPQLPLGLIIIMSINLFLNHYSSLRNTDGYFVHIWRRECVELARVWLELPQAQLCWPNPICNRKPLFLPTLIYIYILY